MNTGGGRQALIEHIRALINHRAPHKKQREQDFDALNQLATDIGRLLDSEPHLIWRLKQQTRNLDGGPSLELERSA